MNPPDLPKLYELVAREQVDSVLQEGCRRAQQGADEGLLVWARAQVQAQGRCGQTWLSPAGGLYAGLVLRPEVSARVATQLGLVAVVALGSAVAEHVQPMTELHYRWPNDLLLRQGKVGCVQMGWRDDGVDGLQWLALSVYVNVAAAPAELGFEAAAVQVDGGCEVTAPQLLASFARQFLGWADRWANEGFAPVRKAWMQRAVQSGEEIEIRAAGHTHLGRLLDLADDGALLLGRGGAVDRITIRDAFAS